MTVCYLGWSSSASHTLAKHANDAPVNLLIAFPELATFNKKRADFNIESWSLDSGAFSAWNSGKTIDLDEYIAVCKDVDACEMFGLDVIGDPEGTKRNLDAMWSAGIDAIPTHHYRSPWEGLEWACKHSEKIALGGMAKSKGKAVNDWILQCFARCWPKAVHGFGVARWEIFELAPFHSVDAVSWCLSPSAFGNWAGYTGKQMPLHVKGMKDFWIEVEEHQRRERWAKWRWRKQLAKLEKAS